MPRRKILIAHPGATSLLYPLVGILEGLDVDLEFHTSVYFEQGGTLDRALDWLPTRLRDSLRRELARRSHPDVNPRLVHQRPLPELAYLAANRLGRAELAQSALHWRNERFDRAVARRVRETPPDLYIGFDGSALHTLEACRERGVPSMLFQAIGHIDSGANVLEEERRLRPEFAQARVAIDTPAWRQRNASEVLLADHVVVPSIYVRDTLLAAGRPDRGIDLLPYPIDTGRFSPAVAPRDGRGLKALFAGVIGMRKGVIYALEAMRRLDRKDIGLTLVGGISDGTAWLEPYRPWFDHIPGVPYAEMPALFRAADAFVFPSLHEGSAMAVNEALASGLPAIVTANSGSIVRDGLEGFLVPIRDVDVLTDRIARLADDPVLRLEMGRAARTRAEAHDFNAYRREFSALIDRILSKR
jgi:glycosyltransferase involved in cell wall biosynthesis